MYEVLHPLRVTQQCKSYGRNTSEESKLSSTVMTIK